MEKVEERQPIILENEGQKIFGMLHLPKNRTAQVPGVLFCHGLAGHKTGKHRVYVDLAYRLSQLGIASLRFDCRGCGDSEGHLHEITPSTHFRDTALCLDYLKNHPAIDSSRIGVFGRSFGGVVAVKVSLMAKGVKSLALWCPMFSGDQWLDQWQLVQTGSVNDDIKREMMQVDSQQASMAFFEEFFYINVADDMKQLNHVPLLHIHGENDARIDISHAHDYEGSRIQSIAQSKFIRLPNTDHDFSHLEERTLALDETRDWFASTL